MIRHVIAIIFILFITFPSISSGKEKKSLPVVVGTALSPLLIGGASTGYDWIYGIFIVTPFAMTTMPMISHAYIGDNGGGFKYTLLKSIGMASWFITVESNYCGEDNANCWYISGSVAGAIVIGTYIYEIVDLIKKTNKINKEAADKVSFSFYSGVNRNRFNLGLSLNF